jgi:uncharacterized repeat protein (TIGR04138 family)
MTLLPFRQFPLYWSREPPDEAGTTGSLYRSGIVADRLGRQNVACCSFRGNEAWLRPAGGCGNPSGETLKMQEINFDEAVELILARDSRFSRGAYTFVREALDHTQKKLIGKEARGQIRHVSGQELLDGIRQFALQQFGPMVVTVFEEWGVCNCRDFGEIVFNMVEIGLLAKTDKDTRDDFQNGYDFTEAFRKPFRPLGKSDSETKPVAN